MQLSGRHTVNASLVKVWGILMDTDTLAKIVPGISRLEKTGDNTYKSFLEIKLGPVSGSFNGNLQMENVEVEKRFTLKVQQNSKIGNANADIKIDLASVGDEQTEINFNGDVKMIGLLASLGQRVMSGVAKTLTKQFFANLDKELSKSVTA